MPTLYLNHSKNILKHGFKVTLQYLIVHKMIFRCSVKSDKEKTIYDKPET